MTCYFWPFLYFYLYSVICFILIANSETDRVCSSRLMVAACVRLQDFNSGNFFEVKLFTFSLFRPIFWRLVFFQGVLSVFTSCLCSFLLLVTVDVHVFLIRLHEVYLVFVPSVSLCFWIYPSCQFAKFLLAITVQSFVFVLSC